MVLHFPAAFPACGQFPTQFSIGYLVGSQASSEASSSFQGTCQPKVCHLDLPGIVHQQVACSTHAGEPSTSQAALAARHARQLHYPRPRRGER